MHTPVFDKKDLMAFVVHIGVHAQIGGTSASRVQQFRVHNSCGTWSLPVTPKRVTLCKAQNSSSASDEPEEDPSSTSTPSPIPPSFEAACEQARQSLAAALAAGCRRLFLELDTTNGDETYTSLKSSLPTVRALLEFFNTSTVQIAFPDAGAAALAKRDWGPDVCEGHALVGIEQYKRRDSDAATIVIVPRASEVDTLAKIVSNAGDDVIIVVNPDLIDMGVTGLSLNARRLRANVIDQFDSAYFLRTYGWGVLHRTFPGNWGVWVDDTNEVSGFRCVTTLSGRPTADQIDEILDPLASEGDQEGKNPFETALRGMRRFLNAYTKG